MLYGSQKSDVWSPKMAILGMILIFEKIRKNIFLKSNFFFSLELSGFLLADSIDTCVKEPFSTQEVTRPGCECSTVVESLSHGRLKWSF